MPPRWGTWTVLTLGLFGAMVGAVVMLLGEGDPGEDVDVKAAVSSRMRASATWAAVRSLVVMENWGTAGTEDHDGEREELVEPEREWMIYLPDCTCLGQCFAEPLLKRQSI